MMSKVRIHKLKEANDWGSGQGLERTTEQLGGTEKVVREDREDDSGKWAEPRVIGKEVGGTREARMWGLRKRRCHWEGLQMKV